MNTNRMISTTKHLPNTFWGSAAAALAAFALAATPATATQVQTQVSSATELEYAADVSNTDLLTGLTAHHHRHLEARRRCERDTTE